MEDTAATRQATKARIGPWYVLQTRNPAAPGMKFSTLLALVVKGQVTPKSVVRGPTTHQLWRFAAHVRGLSREFGICYSCGEALEKTATICPHCDRTQDAPADADALLEPRGNASAVLGGATGNSHFGAAQRRGPSITPPAHNPQPASSPSQSNQQQFQPREYEIPKDPPANVEPTPRRGEHSERLRMFNQEIATRSPRVELRRTDVRGSNVSSTALATAFQVDPNELDHGAGGFKRALVALLIVALIGGGVYFYLNPDARRKTGEWLTQRLEQARAKSGDRPVWDAAPPSPQVARTTTTDRLGSDRSSVGSVVSNSSIPKLGNEKAFVVPHVPVNPAPSPSTQPTTAPSQPTADSLAKNDQKNDSKNQPKNEPTTPPPAPTTPEVQKQQPQQPQQSDANNQAANRRKPQRDESADERPAVLTDDQAIERSRKLWQRAIDSEAKGDFAEAVRCYEEIKSLPRVAHQANLEFRLNNAKRRAGR